jgi:hypothetical protein
MLTYENIVTKLVESNSGNDLGFRLQYKLIIGIFLAVIFVPIENINQIKWLNIKYLTQKDLY